MLQGLAYLTWSLIGFYRDRSLGTMAKSLLLYVVYTVVRYAVGALAVMTILRLRV